MQRTPDWTETRKLFRAMMEGSGILGWICDADGYCIYLSSAWHIFTGSTEGEGYEWLNAIHPDDRIRTRKSFFEANDSQSEYRIEYRVQRADAGYSMAIAHGTPHYSSDGRFLGMFGITSTVHDYVEQASFIKTVDAPPRPKVLSDREREVLELFAEGYTVETVATKLRIAEGTVAHHVRNATLKLGALSRTHAVAKAILLSELQLSS